jgi:hypothetical protein
MHARLKPCYGGTVPQRVHADVFDACLIGGNLDGPQHVARVHRTVRNDPTRVINGVWLTT